MDEAGSPRQRRYNPRLGLSFADVNDVLEQSELCLTIEESRRASGITLKLLAGESIPNPDKSDGLMLGPVPCVLQYNSAQRIPAKIAITNYRVGYKQVIVQPDSRQELTEIDPEFFIYPLLAIERIDQSANKVGFGLEIWTRDNRFLRLSFSLRDFQRHHIYDLIKLAAFPSAITGRFAFRYSLPLDENGWNLYQEEWYFAAFGITFNCPESCWKLIQNTNWDICPSYPNVLVVPQFVTREDLNSLAKFRTKRRFPAMTFLHLRTGATLWRSSQPKTGIKATRNKGDEEYLSYISNSSKGKWLNIFDARPVLNAHANKMKGGGVEHERHYQFSTVTFLCIENIHAMRAAFAMLQALPRDASFSDFSQKTAWLEHICALLRGAILIATSLEQGIPALVHCSDGWDRTSQLCTLTQLMVDPAARSLTGFAVLIEKDWLSFGHQFEVRLGMAQAKRDTDESPIFTQMLDAVWQMLEQFPTHFEFNARLLLDLQFELFTGRFGTFMCNNQRERSILDLRIRTVSVWSWVLSHKDLYRNPFFQPGQTEPLYPIATFRRVSVWREMFWRWHKETDQNAVLKDLLMDELLQEVDKCREELNRKTARASELRLQIAEKQ